LPSLGFLVIQVKSLNCNNKIVCQDVCTSNFNEDNCCVLEEDREENINDSPLGFTLITLPGTESMAAAPCVRVEYPESAIGQSNYLVVSVSGAGRVAM